MFQFSVGYLNIDSIFDFTRMIRLLTANHFFGLSIEIREGSRIILDT